MKKKKYKLNELLEGINENNLHPEIITGPNVGKEITKEEYENAKIRLEELLPITKDVNPEEDPLVAELIIVSDIIEAYEEEHYPIGPPTLGYKGFKGPIEYEEELKSYDGIVKDVEDAVIVYQGETLEELEASFRSGIDLYLEEKKLDHKGFKGSVEFSEKDALYYGKILNLDKHLISYEGKTIEALEKDFKEAIETYLDCKDKLNESGFRSELRVILNKKDWSFNEIFEAIDELHTKYLYLSE
nr:hypothetical protein [uncultured Carboxylicivirga sp.]